MRIEVTCSSCHRPRYFSADPKFMGAIIVQSGWDMTPGQELCHSCRTFIEHQKIDCWCYAKRNGFSLRGIA